MAEVRVLKDSIITLIVYCDTVLLYKKPQYDGIDKWVKQTALYSTPAKYFKETYHPDAWPINQVNKINRINFPY